MSPPYFLYLVVMPNALNPQMVMPRVCRQFQVVKLRICFVVTFISLLSHISYLCCKVWCNSDADTRYKTPITHTHVQKEKQKEDDPTCGLMDRAYQLLGLRLSKPEHLIIRVSLCIYIVSYLRTFSNYCKTVLRIIKNVCFLYIGADSSFAWC